MLVACCGECRNSDELNKFHYRTVLDRTLLNAGVVFPVLGSSSATRLYGQYYIPLIQLSSGYYVTKAASPKEIMRR